MRNVRAELAFERYDSDNSGRINADEFSDVCVELGVDLPREAVLRALSELDADKSGEIEKDEFLRWWSEELEVNSTLELLLQKAHKQNDFDVHRYVYFSSRSK